MATSKKKTKVVAGRLITVPNEDREWGGSPQHWQRVWIDNENGKGERPWYLTPSEVEKLDARAAMNPEDAGKKDPLSDLLD